MGLGFIARGAASYSGQVASFLGKASRFIGQGFTHSFTGTTRQLLTGSGKTADQFFDRFTSGGWKSYAAAGIVSIPTAFMNLTNFFDDGRRMREIASGQSNFHTDRKAATKTWGLSALGLAGSTTLGLSGIAMGALSANPLGMGLTVASGVVATGSLISRQIYKWLTLDLPFKSNAGFGLLSMNKPVLRVEDPSSPYYMMSHMLEKTVKNRAAQDKGGQLGSGYLQTIENLGLGLTDYIMA
jgi:hypothetical protein